MHIAAAPERFLAPFTHLAAGALGTGSLNDAGFENVGASDANEKDTTNYRSWGPNPRLLTADVGQGSGNSANAGAWLIRGFTTDNLDQGDIRDDSVAGKTGDRYFAYGAGLRGAFQFVDHGSGNVSGDFELKVDVYSPAADPNTTTYFLAVIGFDDPGEVTVDIGLSPVTGTLSQMITHSGSSSFELFSSTETSAGDPFSEVTLSGTFSGSHQYIGVLLAVRGGANNVNDFVGFDNIRLNLVPEP